MRRVGIFLFYDADGVVDSYIDHYLKELKTVVEYLVVVVNGKLTPSGRKKFSQLADDFFVRKNEGFDVWAYHDALDYIGWESLKTYDELILANHTLFGPIYPLRDVFEQMEKKDCDWWGLHRRYEDKNATTFAGKPLKFGYLPEVALSNFWVIRKNLLHSFEFKQYWANIPPINNYIESCTYHEPTFTVTMSDAGYTFDTFDGDSQRGIYSLPTVYGALDQITRLKAPFIRRKAFFDPNGTLDYCTDIPRQIIRYLEEETDYDCNLIWENLLRTTNQYDLKNWFNWNTILSADYSSPKPEDTSVAVIFHTYYQDIMPQYLHNILAFPHGTDFYFTTDTAEKLEALKAFLSPYEGRYHISYRLVENRGRDVAALLVGCRDVVIDKKYDLVCFMHDKKGIGFDSGFACTERQFSDCCFENIAPTADYVNNVVALFNKNERLGIAVPPPPKNVHYYQVIGGSWGREANYPHVKQLLQELNISVPLDKEKPPVAPYGTVFWFRPNALLPLFEKEWKYQDFPEEPCDSDGQLGNAIERAYSLIAQGRGYYPSIIMEKSYAEQEVTRMTEIAHTYVNFTLKTVGSKRFLRIATHQFSRILESKSTPLHRNHHRDNAVIKSPERSPVKSFLRSACPIGLWNLARRIKCMVEGGTYIEPKIERGLLKTVARNCAPRFLWESLRSAKCKKNGWVFIPDN